MSDELGIRTPTYRESRSRRMDPATKRLALIAAGLGSALSAVIGTWSVMDHPHHTGSPPAIGTVPVVAPPSGPLRVKPANPGGMQLSAASANLFGAGNAGPGQGKLAPAPEIPDPQALRPPSRPPTPLAATVPPAAPVPLASTPPQEPAAKSPPAAAPPAPAATTRQVRASTSAAVVQLAALPTAVAAKEEWALLQRRLGPLLQGRQPMISSVEIGGRTWWRVRTSGFADDAAAKGFCEQVRAKSLGCDVVRS